MRAANHDGVWNQEGLSLAVTVVPPPWRTWWAKALYGVIAILALLAYLRVQRRRRVEDADYSRTLEREVRVTRAGE